MASFYEITLPMPVSINAAHTIGRGRKGQHMIRSSAYTAWLEYAAIAFRQQYPVKPKELFTGRLRLECILCFIDGARGSDTSDADNRIKACQDFLQGKFFENDKQIDMIVAHRRKVKDGDARVIVRIYEIPDWRYDDPALIFAE